MKERGILMKKKDRKRLQVLIKIKEKLITIKKASNNLRISYRQCKRIFKRFLNEGDKGIINKSCGKPSNHQINFKFKEKIIDMYCEKYKGFGPTLASEKITKDGFNIKSGTLRRWLISEDIWHKKHNRKKHRQRREPKKHFGELVQLDGSHHYWFEKRGEEACLMNMVDDATKTTLSIMSEEETTKAAMLLLWAWIEKYGIPHSLYCDRKNVYITDREPTIEEQLADKEPMTAFGKACEKLGIEIITAHSAQAKGRVERNHGVYQDRFVKELWLYKKQTIEEANKMLSDYFIAELNQKFSIKPQSEKNFHSAIPKNLELRTVFCWEKTRQVSNDWVVRMDNRFYQILKTNKPLPRRKSKVKITEWIDGSIHIYYLEKELQYKEIGVKELAKIAS